jgi:hypothetical protein
MSKNSHTEEEHVDDHYDEEEPSEPDVTPVYEYGREDDLGDEFESNTVQKGGSKGGGGGRQVYNNKHVRKTLDNLNKTQSTPTTDKKK